ncbi:MAG: 4Fe-4S ferredoxin, partial [Actinophytocola sp.]|nr:4Fe-4S ferredoxin [Actinophytocola sp.]
MGFFTDTSVCIGCKACEVACKEWNLVPAGGNPSTEDFAGMDLLGTSYDNTGDLGANSWRHVAFVEQRVPARNVETADLGMPTINAPEQGAGDEESGVRWLMSSDVCKH